VGSYCATGRKSDRSLFCDRHIIRQRKPGKAATPFDLTGAGFTAIRDAREERSVGLARKHFSQSVVFSLCDCSISGYDYPEPIKAYYEDSECGANPASVISLL